MAQWSQGLPEGSTEHCFSASKNSTSSDTVASSTPKRSSLGWFGKFEVRSAECGVCGERGGVPKLEENGASHGDCATCGAAGRNSKISIVASGCEPIEGWVRGGGSGATKLMMRARRDST